MEGKWLHHVVRLQPGLLHSLLHHLHGLHTGHGVKVAVDAYDLGTWGAGGDKVFAVADKTTDFHVRKQVCDGAGWVVYTPAFTSLTAHSPGEMPCMSPSGPMHREAATGFPLVFSTCTAHSASSTCSKYCNDRKTHSQHSGCVCSTNHSSDRSGLDATKLDTSLPQRSGSPRSSLWTLPAVSWRCPSLLSRSCSSGRTESDTLHQPPEHRPHWPPPSPGHRRPRWLALPETMKQVKSFYHHTLCKMVFFIDPPQLMLAVQWYRWTLTVRLSVWPLFSSLSSLA